EEVKDFHAEDGEIEDDILCENLSKINLLITKIEAINSNPPPSFGSNSSGSTTTRSDYSLPDYEAFYFDDDHIEEKNSGSTTTYDFYHEEFADELAHIISPLEYACFYFRSEPDPGDLTFIDPGIRKNVSSMTNVNLPFEDDQSPLLAYVVWIFLPFLTISGRSVVTASVIETTPKRKSADVGWEFGYLADPKHIDKVKCNICGKIVSGGVHRLKLHVAGIQGDVTACEKSTTEQKLKCRNALNEVKLKKKNKQAVDDALRSEVNIGSNETVDLDEMEYSFGDLKSPTRFGPLDRFTTVEDCSGWGEKQSNLSYLISKKKR
ncbi:hypothetical protein Tco_0356317, partial [Tanacetum coccineum]